MSALCRRTEPWNVLGLGCGSECDSDSDSDRGSGRGSRAGRVYCFMNSLNLILLRIFISCTFPVTPQTESRSDSLAMVACRDTTRAAMQSLVISAASSHLTLPSLGTDSVEPSSCASSPVSQFLFCSLSLSHSLAVSVSSVVFVLCAN